MLDPRTFLGAVIAGTERPDQIDHWVERWHEQPGTTPLSTFLGFTAEEYTNWMLAPACLPHLVETRRLVEAARQAVQVVVAKEQGLQ
jgi:hypothetical protein